MANYTPPEGSPNQPEGKMVLHVPKMAAMIPPTAVPTETPTATAGEAEILSLAEMREKGLVEGDAIRVKGEYKGIPVDVTFAVSQPIADRLPGHGLKLTTPEGSELSGKERVMKAVLLAYFRLYRERKYLSLEAYPFEQYLADIKADKDLSVDVYLVDPATSEGATYQISPAAPLTLVVTDQQISPNGNAPFLYSVDWYIGFNMAPDRSVKIVFCDENPLFKSAEPGKKLPLYITKKYYHTLAGLRWQIQMQQRGLIDMKDVAVADTEDSLAQKIEDLVCPTDPTEGWCVPGTQIFQPRK
jgi:hypothetical protein